MLYFSYDFVLDHLGAGEMSFEKEGNNQVIENDNTVSMSQTPVATIPGAHRTQPSQTAAMMMHNMPANPVAPQQKQHMTASVVSTTPPSCSNTELLSAFECPVCLEYMLPPYLQCNSGHLLCSNCRPKVASCPACRGPVPNIRNLAMEKIASQMLFPCKFNTSGCTSYFLHHQKVEHEERCDFRPYCCPCPGASCKWQGGLNEVMGHLMKLHKSITTLQGEDIVFLATDINLPGAVDWVMMQSCFDSYFMLVLEKQDKQDPTGQSYQMFYAVVQLIGTKAEAERFSYKMELSAGRRRLAWEATPRSIHEGVNTAISQSDCLAFDTNHAQLFAEQGNLGINVTISQVQVGMDANQMQVCR
uniref:E3 ubiquitin-protein ligase n=1 Tax=Bursaphelenchus xylophilus TaxID=6326 RepID=A0A1I7S3A3_BURXY